MAKKEIRIPNLDNMYHDVVAFVKKHQGEKGYINTDPCPKDNIHLDTIYAFVYDEVSGCGTEEIVFGVRVTANNDLEVITRPWMRTYHNNPTEEEYADNNNWFDVKWGDRVYYIHTIFAIAELIKEYTEE